MAQQSTPAQPEDQRTAFIGRVQEQRQFLVVVQGLLAHHQRWQELAARFGPEFDSHKVPGSASYANIFILHGIGGIGKSWLTRRCLTLAADIPLQPPILTFYDDVSLGAPVLEPAHLLDRLTGQIDRAGYRAALTGYRQAQADLPLVVERVTRYQFEKRERWDELLDIAAGLVARSAPEAGYHSFAQTSLAHTHASGAEAGGRDAATLIKAYDLLLEQMQKEGHLSPPETALFRNPPAAQAAQLVTGLEQIAHQRPLVIGLDNLEIVVPLEPFIRDCLVLPTNHAPIIWVLSGRYNLADERVVEIGSEKRIHKGYRDLLGENPPVVWDMSIFGDADLRDYLVAEAERRRAALLIDDDLIEAVKATSSGVPLVVEMVVDALFTMERSEFLQEFALDDRNLLPSDRLDRITARFLRYCLTHPQDLERVQAMALLRKGIDEPALAAAWNLGPNQSVLETLYELRARYAFVLPDGLHDAVYEFVRRQLRTDRQTDLARDRLSRRAARHYRAEWEALTAQFDDSTLRVRNPRWQRATRDLLNALLWYDPDEAILFLLPRFIEGLGFDRAFANGLLLQAEEFLADDSVSSFSQSYAALLHRMRVGMQEIDWTAEEPGQAIGGMLESLLEAPGLQPLHVSILHIWQGNWLVENGRYDEGLTAYLQAQEHLPADATGLARQLGKAFYELSSRFLWPVSAAETAPSEPGLQAARQAVALNPDNAGAWFNLGVALDYLGQETEALPAYERAIALEPRAPYYNNLGDLYGALGRDDEALAAYQQALTLDPTYSWPYHSLGLMHAEQGDYDQALDFLQQAIEHHQRDKDRAVSWDTFGDVHAALGNDEEAISAYRWAGVLNPKFASPWYGLGNVYGRLERYGEAIDAYQRAITLDPDHAWAYHKLGLIFARQGDQAAAISHYHQAIERHDEAEVKAVSWQSLGDLYRSAERYQDALEAYRQALKLDPTQAEGWNSLGDVYRQLDRSDAALVAYQRATDLDPELVAAWDSLASLYSAQGRQTEAIEAYERVIALAPAYPWPYNNLGYIYAQRGDLPQAVNYFEQALERHEDEDGQAITWSNLGDVQVRLGNRPAAIEAYRRATVLAPHYPWPHHNLAQVYEAEGEDELAVGAYRQAIDRHERDQDRALSWFKLAQVYQRLERPQAALEAYQAVVRLDPDHSRAWELLGDVQLALEQPVEAERSYRRALELDPTVAAPYHNLGLIAAERGEQEAAISLYRQAIERETAAHPRAVSWHKLGQAQVALDRPADAAQAFRQAIELDPTYAPPYHHLGLIEEEQGAYETALTLYQQALDRYPAEEETARAQVWFGLGRGREALDRPDEALTAYGQAAELDPAQAALWDRLGNLYRRRSEDEAALKSYRRALELDPTLANPHQGLGLLYEKQAEPEQARHHFRRALERYPDTGREVEKGLTWQHLGQAYQALEQYPRAIEAYRQALEYIPDEAEPWRRLGDIYLAQERQTEAIESYQRAVEVDPTVAAPWLSLGDIYVAQERDPAAIEAYRRAIDLDPQDPHPHHQLGQIYERLDDRDAAINYYEQAIRRYDAAQAEAQARAWYGLGNVYRVQDRTEPAIEAYQRSLELNETDARPYHQLGLIYHALGRYESAIIQHQQALEYSPQREEPDRERAVIWSDLGDTYAQVGRLDEAIDAYQQAVALDGDYARPWTRLGDVYRRQSRFKAAKGAYQQAIALDPAHAWSYNNLGLVHERLGEYDAALERFQQAIERQEHKPARAVSLYNLGNIHFARGAYEPALKAYRQAIALDPTYARPWNSLGDLYRAQGRREGVTDAYRRAIELEPSFAWPYHNLGTLYRNQQAYAQATTYYRQALERHEQDRGRAVSWSGLGDVHRLQGQYDQAIEAYRRSIELNPADAWPRHNLGFVYKTLGHHQQAIEHYQQAIDRFEQPRFKAVSWNNLGNVYSLLGRYKQAVDAYRQAIDLNPDYALPWNSLGETYHRLDRTEEAAEAFQKAIERDSGYVLAWTNLGDAYRRLGRLEETITAYERAIQLDDRYAWPHHNLGLVHEERGDYESAIACFQAAIERHPDRGDKAGLWDKIGGLYRIMGQEEKAIEAYRQATELDRRYASPWYSLGNIYAALEQDEEAITAYRRTIELSPTDPWPRHNLALVYERREQYGEAIALYRQAIERHANDRNRAISWDSLGNLYTDMGRFEEAVEAFQEGIRLNPDYALPWNSLGDVYRSLGDHAQAVDAYRRAIALDPDYVWSYNSLGLAYESLGQYEQAIETHRDVLTRHATDRDQAVTWGNLGNIYEALRRENEAIAAYERAIELDPDYVWPYNSLGVIYERRGDQDQAFALYQQATRRHRRRTLES